MTFWWKEQEKEMKEKETTVGGSLGGVGGRWGVEGGGVLCPSDCGEDTSFLSS